MARRSPGSWWMGMVVLAVLGGGCGQADPRLGAPPTCTDKDPSKCGTGAVGAQGAAGSGGGSAASGSGAGGAQAGSLAGTIGILVSETFDQSQTFNGKATVSGNKLGGGQAQADYAGASTGFHLQGLVSGKQWIFVKDAAGGSGFLSTYSVHDVPSANVTLPVIDATVMNKIASALPMPAVVNPDAAQLVLYIEHNGKPFTGVSVMSAGAGIVAYDKGPGIYSNQATGTGTAGVILVLNAPAPMPGKISVSLVDAMSIPYMLGDIPVGPGTATIAGFTL